MNIANVLKIAKHIRLHLDTNSIDDRVSDKHFWFIKKINIATNYFCAVVICYSNIHDGVQFFITIIFKVVHGPWKSLVVRERISNGLVVQRHFFLSFFSYFHNYNLFVLSTSPCSSTRFTWEPLCKLILKSFTTGKCRSHKLNFFSMQEIL